MVLAAFHRDLVLNFNEGCIQLCFKFLCLRIISALMCLYIYHRSALSFTMQTSFTAALQWCVDPHAMTPHHVLSSNDVVSPNPVVHAG